MLTNEMTSRFICEQLKMRGYSCDLVIWMDEQREKNIPEWSEVQVLDDGRVWRITGVMPEPPLKSITEELREELNITSSILLTVGLVFEAKQGRTQQQVSQLLKDKLYHCEANLNDDGSSALLVQKQVPLIDGDAFEIEDVIALLDQFKATVTEAVNAPAALK